ncbi:MAG: phosphotransferase family protein [Myxococcales bacterium]|nr:phosphotransferase family protein [Polyangiaceae bacterium]MDW8249503.1 phosphotransferase family protein [Myxococcales bacterium]
MSKPLEDLLDQPGDVRPGEELDARLLTACLREHLGLQGEVTVRQFGRGHSNLTYLVTVEDRELVLRRPPFGSTVKTAHDMGREFRILQKLSAVYPRAPRPLLYLEEDSPLGVPFYLMERLQGIILRKDLPAGLVMAPEEVRKLHTNLIDALAELHRLDPERAGLGDLGRPQGYVERQVSGWIQRYEAAKTEEIEAAPRVAAWLQKNRPRERGASLIHNDFKLDNVVLDPAEPTRIIGVLDWEMSTLGDPLMDLGTTLSYWINRDDDDELQLARWTPTTLPGSLTRAELVERYAEQTGIDTSGIVFYYAFGLFKTAGVLQQIYSRYRQGLTKDERFATLILGVHVLMNAADRAIARGTV